jgi:hypothetical protein
MSHHPGRPFQGTLRSADASSGVAVPIFELGSKTAYTLGDDEFLDIHSVSIVTAAGGDSYVLVGPDSSLATGETIVRGDFAANGGIAREDLCHSGKKGETLWAVAPAGNIDVKINGTIRVAGTGERPSWKEAGFGQS